MPESLIKVENLTRRDPVSRRDLLRDVSLAIDAGVRIGLSGPTGSGKSTLLRAIVLLDPLDSGRITYRGNVISGNQVPRFRRRVIYLPQRTSLVAGTVQANLQLPFTFASCGSPYHHDDAQTLLKEATGSIDLMHRNAETLSGGERQIIAIVRALLLNPEVMLLDEPTTGLDQRTTERIERLVMQWYRSELLTTESNLRRAPKLASSHSGPASSGTGPASSAIGPEPDEIARRSFIWTSHDRAQIDRVTDRVLFMRSGRITHEGSDD